MGIGPNHDRDVPLLHQTQHLLTGIELRNGFVQSTGVELHGDTGRGDAIQCSLHKGLDLPKIPLIGCHIFDQVRVSQRIEQSGFRRLRQVLEIHFLIIKGTAHVV